MIDAEEDEEERTADCNVVTKQFKKRKRDSQSDYDCRDNSVGVTTSLRMRENNVLRRPLRRVNFNL